MANLTNLNNKFLVQTGGNVLINKTAANNATVGTQIMSTGDVNATVSGDTVARFNRLSSDGEIIRIQKDTSTVGYIGSNAAGGDPVLDIGSDSSGDSLMRFLTSGSERIRIDKDGNVGIGVTSPSYMLDVAEKIRIVGGMVMTATTSTLYATDGALSYYGASNAVYLNGAGPSGWLRLNGAGSENDRNSINIYGSGGDYMNFRTANSERMRIDGSGIVYVFGATPSTSNSLQMQYNSTAGSAEIYAKSTGGNTHFVFYTSNAGVTNEKMRINNLGNVGIGTTSPSDKLEVAGLTNYTGLTLKGTGASRPALTFKNVNQSLLGAIYGTEGRAITFDRRRRHNRGCCNDNF